MTEPLPILLVPGLNFSARLYAAQVPALWRHGPVTIADHTRDPTMAAIAARILATAPPKFALAGFSMGGYISFEIMRQAPERVARLALIDTSARPDAPEQTERRRRFIARAAKGEFAAVLDELFPLLFHPSRHQDEALRRVSLEMGMDVGAAGHINQQQANMARIDSRPTLAAIRCPTLVIVGDSDVLTPPAMAQEIASGIADAKLITVPECGHSAPLERPEAVTDALVAWLSR